MQQVLFTMVYPIINYSASSLTGGEINNAAHVQSSPLHHML